jgi:hypothetical protein
MSTSPRPRAPWIYRATIAFSSVLLALLLFWASGYLLRDVSQIKGPDYESLEAEFVSAELTSELERVQDELQRTERQIQAARERQQVVRDSSGNLQSTIGELIALQRLSLEKEVSLDPAQQTAFRESMDAFLANQARYQEIGTELARLTDLKVTLTERQTELHSELEEQRRPAREEYNRRMQRHRIRLAALQLALLLPLLVVSGYLVVWRRTSLYLAFAGAMLVRTGMVIHQYFPARFFRYIVMAVAILAVLRVLLYFVRTVARPAVAHLQKQYRDAYEHFLCPVCEFPIRRGVRQSLYWTRRTVGKHVPPTVPSGKAKHNGDDKPYTCPSCGTPLFSACPECGGIRHTLLKACVHCGATGPDQA